MGSWWDKAMEAVSNALAEPGEQETKTKTKWKKKVWRELVPSDKVVRIAPRAMLKNLALQSVTSIEWSGYGPLTRNGDGWTLHDFYYLSSGDTQASSELAPEAVYEAWKRTREDGYDTTGMTLAWVHCHPWGVGGSGVYYTSFVGGVATQRSWTCWSGVDETAIRDQIRWTGGSQVSILFGEGDIEARYDDQEVSEQLKVLVDWGDFAADVERARELYRARPRPVAKKQKKQASSEPIQVTVPLVACHKCGEKHVCLECCMCKEKFCVECLSVIDKDYSLCVSCDAVLDTNCETCYNGMYECYKCKVSLCNYHAVVCELCGAISCDAHIGDMMGAKICEVCNKELIG